ncbi:hypothetical protein BG011_006353 [Mortierella polycephala]|uniref:Cas12f1-like TNB domain-containing protein n=1 Tax=Mortierella polycephala TaxID=41804 RepID=A0A9P6PTS3_9FUNG|nr:hypothetical protein BG011_006353 [Mortierella polycephala]
MDKGHLPADTLSRIDSNVSAIENFDKDLRELLQSLARPEFPNTPHSSLRDMYLWISDKEPGYLITTFLTDVGSYSEEQRKKQRGYIVIGVNEFYTSKKCPVCEGFVGQVNIRRLHCPTCETNIQQRPLYLQPIDCQGCYPWMDGSSSSSSNGGGCGDSGSGSDRKRQEHPASRHHTRINP